MVLGDFFDVLGHLFMLFRLNEISEIFFKLSRFRSLLHYSLIRIIINQGYTLGCQNRLIHFELALCLLTIILYTKIRIRFMFIFLYLLILFSLFHHFRNGRNFHFCSLRRLNYLQYAIIIAWSTILIGKHFLDEI